MPSTGGGSPRRWAPGSSAPEKEGAVVDTKATGTVAHTGRSQAQATPWSRAVACVCFEVTGPVVTAGLWRPGPLPVALPDGRHADQLARASYFQARAAEALYGSRDGLSPVRWHKEPGGARIEEGSVIGVELLGFPRYATAPETGNDPAAATEATSRYLCVLHLALNREDPLRGLAAAVRLDPRDPAGARRRARYAELAGSGFRVPPTARRGLSVSMLTFRDQLRPPPGAPGQWTAATAWLWAAASATPLQQFSPDAEDPHVLDGLVYLSSSWRALALRDGVGFLGLVPDPVDKTGFFAWGESYVRSLYTDVALLAALERDALDGFANRLAHIGNRFAKSHEFRRLVNEVTEFRNVFWWENVTRHGNANVILEQLHAAHRTPRLFTRVIADLEAFRQQVEAQAQEASFLVQEREERRSRSFERAASVAVVAVGLPALIFTALALPIQGMTSKGHDLQGWLILTIGLGSMLLGAIVGAAGSRWISKRAT
jgi:hypothetical protein